MCKGVTKNQKNNKETRDIENEGVEVVKKKYKYVRVKGYTRKVEERKVKVRPHIKRVVVKRKVKKR